MTWTAKKILHSISPKGVEIKTVQCRYPKFIHGEVMTHRVFSRNASSSRAIPVERLIQDVLDDPAMPVAWYRNKPGMQGAEEIHGLERESLIEEWLRARDSAVASARIMLKYNAHKQHINRVLEPFCHINTLITSTQWSNWEALRLHEDADPNIQRLARAIKDAFQYSIPTLLQPGEWHLPYVTEVDEREIGRSTEVYTRHELNARLIKVSVARCARVSYLTQEGKKSVYDEDLKLYERLVGSNPLHASPAEHQATPDDVYPPDEHFALEGSYMNPRLHGNFHGWIQYRKTLKGECQ